MLKQLRFNKKGRNRLNRRRLGLVELKRSLSRLKNLTPTQLAATAADVREQNEKRGFGSQVRSMMPCVVEAIRRTQGFLLHPVQMEGAMITASGQIIEMQTGEGKTVVTGAAAMLNALLGNGTHVATTNDYLAERDYQTLEPAFDLLGLRSGLLPKEMLRAESRKAYDCQITYGPGYQFGFDFLFDQITMRQHSHSHLGRSIVQQLEGFSLDQELVQMGGLDVCIVDEADSVLIDEATTPLILSFDSDEKISARPYHLAKSFVLELDDEDFQLDFQTKQIKFTDAGRRRMRDYRRNKQLVLERPWKSYVRSALYAQHFLERDRDYVVQDDEVNIVDQFTGRIFDDRTWQAGLHQAVEAKEGVDINPPRVSKARITRQRFMQLYQKVSGLSGTAIGGSRDFREFYQVNVVSIATHLPCQRILFAPRFFADQDSRISAIVAEVQSRRKTGQPILIGTNTIRDSIAIQEAFDANSIEAEVLNGIQDQEEAEIIAQAGQLGAVTVATNMAGRGTDIKLSEQAKELGGLHVIGAAPNQSRRIDRQLIGRAARQGQPGSAQFFVAADDELLTKFAPALSKRISSRCGRDGESQIKADREIANLQASRDLAEFQRRQEMVMRDNWMDSVRDSVFGEAVHE